MKLAPLDCMTAERRQKCQCNVQRTKNEAVNAGTVTTALLRRHTWMRLVKVGNVHRHTFSELHNINEVEPEG